MLLALQCCLRRRAFATGQLVISRTVLRPSLSGSLPRSHFSSSRARLAAQRASASTSACASPAVGSRAGQRFLNPYADARAPNAAELKIIASTVPVLAQHGLTLTTLFYQKVFHKHPQLKNIFNQAHQATGMQPKALAEAVYAYAANIENLGALGSAVAHMAHKHASLSILPEHYPIVGHNLLETLDELLTSAGFARNATDDIIAAWKVAYAQLANILITTEEGLYRAAETAPGGWRGWRKFVVTERVDETARGSNVGPITSFTLTPKDSGLVPPYLPGQYTTVLAQLLPDVSVVGEALSQPRQYSLSKAADNKSFRITVKREDPLPAASPVAAAATKAQCPFTGKQAKAAPGSLAGVVSSWVHSQLQVGSEVDLAPPFGEFVLAPGSHPVVLIGAGVGITPLVPMLETAAADGRRVSLLYATHSSNKHPLRSWFAGHRASGAGLQDAASAATAGQPAATVQGAGKGDVSLKVWYEAPLLDTDVLGATFDYTGRMDLAKLSDSERQHLLPPEADYYVCGPLQFMQAQLAQLRKLGVAEAKLHAEIFGAGGL